MVLLPHCCHWEYLDESFTTTWFKVSSFILVPGIPEVLSDCAGRFLSYFPRLSSTSSQKNFNNGTLFPWIPCKIISKKSPQLHLLTKQKKATIAFWNRLGHDKLTRTGRMNQHFPYLHYTPWKDLTLVRLHVFFSAFDQRFVDETGFSDK